ncbi:chemotaxis protein methyltransferase cher2 [mine drainage metagenome]|uniref:protein-glutamate O-methyltransferase n=1 Tax=mine drainage metagenome TaxID=410659 RepID=A0A1J5S4C6_9ZZZZ
MFPHKQGCSVTIKKVVRNPKNPPVEAKPAPVKVKQTDAGFHIVGIGASAGGLEAFEQFFRSIPPDSGMAFVLVSHLDPDHDSMLTEILQRTTTMPVVEARDHVKVERNCVYVLPPNREMAIFHGNLQLSTPEMPRGQRMVIDSFLRSLAEDQGEKAVGIILSGTGTDGTLGLRSIQGAGGITLVQDPGTAKYDGMPVSAIQAGYASYTLPVEKMPEQLLNNKLKLSITKEATPSPAAENGLSRILMLLRSGTGNDFSLYKKSTIGRRIERRMSQHNIDDMDTYARYLKEHPPEVQSLFKELLINVTSFFRDPEAFVVLKQNILPELLKNKPEHYVFRVWVAGCATGEEAYSIAILLHELMSENQSVFKTQIYSTDLDDDAIAIARAGVYPPNIAQDVTPERLRRFFIKEDAGYRVKKEIREMVVFATQNIIKDPPFTKLDLLSCRNLMIYLEPELQNRVIPAFHYALKPGGVLFLSPSESIGNHVELFTALNRKWKFYQTTPSIASNRTMMSSGLSWTKDNPTKGPDDVTAQIKETDFAELTRRALLQSYAPASVVTNTKGDILFVHGDTGKYLRPAPGQATLNVIEMAREGLQLELRTAIQETADKGIPVLNREASFGSNGNIFRVSFSVRPLPVANIGQGLLLVSFQDVIAKPEKAAESSAIAGKPARGKRPAVSAEQRRIEELERDLTYTKENLHATIEEQQASNEELKSANEEMQSTNEELQSTNEELETSKEELQSVNEELVTVNAELQNKIEQLAGMQNDMKNLLDNINIGTVFLNDTLNIKRFTREAVQVYRLVASDVGRPLGDIKSNIKDDDLLADAQAVLDTLVPREREVSTASGAWYQARIQPYRTLDNVIDGVVLTFTDITKRLLAETATRDARELSESIVNTVHEPLIVLDGTCKIVLASNSFYDSFKVSPQDTVGRQLYELGNRQWDIPKLRELLESLLPGNQVIEGFEVEHDFPVIGKRKMLLNARRITGKAEGTPLILLAIEEVK